MKLLVVFVIVLAAVNANSDKDQWLAFKQTHGKTYKSLVEERVRYSIFQSNLRTIEEHNARYDNGEETYFLGITRFADMTQEEFSAKLNLQIRNKPDSNGTSAVFPENLKVPDSIDWTAKGAVLRVKNQGDCGSCWSFSATGAMEGQNAIHHKVKTPLSEQQLLDCSRSYLNGNCDEGGNMVFAFQYVRDLGIEPESAYPYVAKDTPCKYDAKKTIVKVKDIKQVTPSEEELRKAVGTVGPVSIAMHAQPLGLYQGGIFDGRTCTDELNHGVLAVGYGVENGVKFWKIKNSWGEEWGEAGFFRIKRDAGNLCGLANDPSYPILK